MEPAFSNDGPETPGPINHGDQPAVHHVSPNFSVTPQSKEHALPTEVEQHVQGNAPTDLQALANSQPVAVVKALSVRGVEYLMMTLSLWVTSAGLIWMLLSATSGDPNFETMVYPASFLIVTLPIFAFFYLRLRKAELENPELRFDPSKRRLSQVTQAFAFIICLANAITFVYQVLSSFAGGSDTNLLKALLNLFLVLLVAGGILAYYWFDEHRNFKRG